MLAREYSCTTMRQLNELLELVPGSLRKGDALGRDMPNFYRVLAHERSDGTVAKDSPTA